MIHKIIINVNKLILLNIKHKFDIIFKYILINLFVLMTLKMNDVMKIRYVKILIVFIF